LTQLPFELVLPERIELSTSPLPRNAPPKISVALGAFSHTSPTDLDKFSEQAARKGSRAMKRLLLAALAAAGWSVASIGTFPIPVLEAQLHGGGAATHVANNVALSQAPASAARIFRDGATSAGDGGAAPYTWFAAACSLNSGAGDNGSQVAASGGGCWIADFGAIQVTPMIWGAIGDGAVNDTVPVQAAITACGVLGFPLNFDAQHLYNITATLNITQPCSLNGQYRYGIWAVNQPTGSGAEKCPWGLVTNNTGITMINAAAVTGTIRGMCIDMTGHQNINPTSGAAIQIKPPTSATYSSGWHVEQNTILQPYDGITIPGNGGGAGCCGIGTSADGDAILYNTIVSPSDAGIAIGKNSAATAGGPGTVGITVTDNNIVCKTTTSKAHAYGIVIYEGAIWYDGTQNGPEGCNIGTAVIPGTLGGHSQAVEFNGDGVFGDQSGKYNLLIQPQSGGAVVPVTIGGKGPWANSTTNTGNILIDGASYGGTIEEVAISGIYASAGFSATYPGLDIEGGSNGPFDVHIANSLFCGQGSATGTTAIKLNAGSGSTGRWTFEGNHVGTGCLSGRAVDTGVKLIINSGSSSNGAVTIVGNDLSAVKTPISYTPNTSVLDHVIIAANQGIDDRFPTVASAANIPYPGPYPRIAVSGTTAVNTIGAGFSNQRLAIAAVSGFTWNSGGGTGTLCGRVNLSLAAGNEYQFMYKGAGQGSCWSHLQ
jgi:hypothetical protein